jgi:hypothetical protein
VFINQSFDSRSEKYDFTTDNKLFGQHLMRSWLMILGHQQELNAPLMSRDITNANPFFSNAFLTKFINEFNASSVDF